MRLSTALFKTISVSLTLAALFACSNSKSDSASNMIDAAGKHVVGSGYTSWRQQHWVVYDQMNGGSSDRSTNTVCSQCHGIDLSGGIAKVSCFSESYQGASCHANADGSLGHPSSWADPTAGTDFHGLARFGFPATPVQGSATLTADCGLCHAVATNTALIGSAPSCITTDARFGIACHSSSPAANSSGCVSCHGGKPTGPTGQAPVGNAYPNLAEDHSSHIANFGLGCTACHKTYGTHTPNHATGNGSVFLNISGGYKALSGTFKLVGGKCSAISCHGGQQTPSWVVGTPINVDTQCTSCHEQGAAFQSPQYNSFYSGKKGAVNLHQLHLSKNNPATGNTVLIFCTDCHSTSKLTFARHFGHLATHNFDGGDPMGTVGGGDTVISSGQLTFFNNTTVTGQPSTNVTCAVEQCHGPRIEIFTWINP